MALMMLDSSAIENAEAPYSSVIGSLGFVREMAELDVSKRTWRQQTDAEMPDALA